MKNTIYYFTGTGNSLKLSKDIAKELSDCEVLSIVKTVGDAKDIEPEGTVGFVFPVYYCGLPQIVVEFLSSINLEKTEYLFVAAAYGATGGNAGCLMQAKKIIEDKGKCLNAGYYVKMVDNFIIWSWDVPPIEKHPVLHRKAALKATEIARATSQKKVHFDKSITERVGPIIFCYQHFAKNVNRKDQAFFVTEQCNGCGLCAKICPTQNLEMMNNKPVWKSRKCQCCLACLHLCPQKACQYGSVTIKRHRYRNPYITLDEMQLNTSNKRRTDNTNCD